VPYWLEDTAFSGLQTVLFVADATSGQVLCYHF
jgi:hypothetical protein